MRDPARGRGRRRARDHQPPPRPRARGAARGDAQPAAHGSRDVRVPARHRHRPVHPRHRRPRDRRARRHRGAAGEDAAPRRALVHDRAAHGPRPGRSARSRCCPRARAATTSRPTSTFAESLGERVALAIENARLYEAVHAALAGEREARLRADFLANAGALLDASLDYEQTLANVARITVPEIADWCAVSVLDDGGQPARGRDGPRRPGQAGDRPRAAGALADARRRRDRRPGGRAHRADAVRARGDRRDDRRRARGTPSTSRSSAAWSCARA